MGLKTTNSMFVDKQSGEIMTREWYVDGSVQKMRVIKTDPLTTKYYKMHLDRVSLVWVPNDEPPKAPHGSTGGDNLSQDPKAIWARENRKKKRGW